MKNSGFTLIELMVAMTVFLIIGGVAMSLFQGHVTQFTAQQNQVTLNTSLRNALTQMEVDIANAGTGYFTTVDKANFPIGVTITSGGGLAACNNGQTYPAACFDTLNIISVDSSTPPGQADDGTGSGCTNTNLSTNALVIPPPAGVLNPATGLPWTVAQYAAQFKTNDQILFSAGLNYNTAVLTQNGAVSGNDVLLTHQKTNVVGQPNGSATDFLGISSAPDPNLTVSFCAGLSWVMRLAAPVTYGVDTATNPANPALFKSVGGVQTPIADQIIGFRIVSTMLGCNEVMTHWPAPGAQPQCLNNGVLVNTNFNQIRALEVSLIGRTTPLPGAGAAGTFHNLFDNGPYKIEAVSITANPRNLSMND